MMALLNTIGIKNILLFTLIVAAITNFVYSNNKITNLDTELTKTSTKLSESINNNKLIIEAYEQTIRINDSIIREQSISTEQKEKVVVKYKTLYKEVQKRGEVKQDENSSFTIVTF